ncbi:FAD:protein FMN transferase [Knoellia locipacati]|uniref:FAD:protein FMN transferase n=1 Tax=Knoellia locipacati TaxID=882824 RepID=A0A512SVP3_9MICO|nr:FAD:protein FMN transferase [Knoellia locipacati]GEQ12012.1 FAD:protein FMN transferase [Knoellia locipacati]
MSTLEIPVRTSPAAATRRAFVHHVMGTAVSIHVRATDPHRPDIEAASDRVLAHLRRVDRVLSTWRADSDLLRLQHGELDADDAHPWVAEVTDLCLEAEDRTDGLFRAWRSTAGGRSTFDPTGLVKGWAVSAASAHLETVPGISFSIGAGGDVVVGTGRGWHDDPPVWRIGIEDPRDRREVAEVVTLTRGAVATSGAAARGAHIVDPRTGRGIDRPGSATVVGPDLLWADVWATAAFVDPARAGRLLEARDPAYRLLAL